MNQDKLEPVIVSGWTWSSDWTKLNLNHRLNPIYIWKLTHTTPEVKKVKKKSQSAEKRNWFSHHRIRSVHRCTHRFISNGGCSIYLLNLNFLNFHYLNTKSIYILLDTDSQDLMREVFEQSVNSETNAFYLLIHNSGLI